MLHPSDFKEWQRVPTASDIPGLSRNRLGPGSWGEAAVDRAVLP